MAAPPPAGERVREPTRRASGAILLVDDHRENLAALEAVLEPLGEALISVDSGEEALRVLLHEEVAVILLDVRMAGLDGVQTARIIRSRPATRHIPIIFLTALVSDVDEMEVAYATGAVDYVIKPFEPSILRAKVMAFVALARERAERLRESRARARAEAAARAVRTLQALSDATLLHLELDRLADELLERAGVLFAADAAALLLSGAGGEALTPFASRGGALQTRQEAIVPGRALAALLAGRRAALLAAGDEAWEELVEALPDAPLGQLERILAVPLVHAGQLLGLLLLGAGDATAFAEPELELLGLAADRIAIAIDHAQRFEHERELVEALQLSLLPERLPEHGRVELAARYLPGGSGAQIGGDWYDALALDHDRLALIIGDVVGHGIRAASRMGELRNALRAYAAEGHGPAAALHRLDQLVKTTIGRELIATVIFAVLDTAAGTVRLASAGHPPAVLRSAGGVSRLMSASTLPIGLMGAQAPQEVTAPFAAGDTLVLYTDGLVERRSESIDDGIDRMAEVVALDEVAPAALCARLVSRLVGDEADSRDDIAVLAARLRPPGTGALELRLQATGAAVTAARHALRDWLSVNAPELDEVGRGDVEVAFSEACTNVVRHAYGPASASFSAGADRRGAEIVLTVADEGRWRAPRGDHGGRGLDLMRALCAAVEVEPGVGGTLVRMRFPLPGDGQGS